MYVFETTTTVYCHHHSTMGGIPTFVMPSVGITALTHEVSRRDEIALIKAGITTARRNRRKKKQNEWRGPLTLPLLLVLHRKIFEIHCEKGCRMFDVIMELAKGYVGNETRFRVTYIRPDEGYAWLHREDYIIRPRRIVRVYLQVESNRIASPSDKIRKRGRRLYSVMRQAALPDGALRPATAPQST